MTLTANADFIKDTGYERNVVNNAVSMTAVASA